MFALFALFKIKVSIILKMIHETITYRSKIVKHYVSPEERRYISIYYYHLLLLLLLLLLLFSAFSILYITSFSIRTNRNNKKLPKERERFFSLFIPQASDRSSGVQENSPLQAQFRLNRQLKYPETLVTTSLPEKIQAVTYWCQGSFFRLRPCCST